MYEFSRWRSVEQFDPYSHFKNETNDFGIEYLLSKSKEPCEDQGTVLNVFDPDSTNILKLVQFILRKREEERFNFNIAFVKKKLNYFYGAKGFSCTFGLA